MAWPRAVSSRADGDVERALERRAEAEPAGYAGQHLVGEEIEIAGQRAEFHLVDAEIGEDRQVADREYLVKILIVRDLDAQMIEDLTGERPFDRRGQVGQEDRDMAADHAERHEEVVADRRQANRPADAGLLPQGVDEAVQVPAERGGQDYGFPNVVFPVDDDGK